MYIDLKCDIILSEEFSTNYIGYVLYNLFVFSAICSSHSNSAINSFESGTLSSAGSKGRIIETRWSCCAGRQWCECMYIVLPV